jgi:hypothetical protein
MGTAFNTLGHQSPVEFVVDKPPIPIVDGGATFIQLSAGPGLVSAYQTTGHPPIAGDHALF